MRRFSFYLSLFLGIAMVAVGVVLMFVGIFTNSTVGFVGMFVTFGSIPVLLDELPLRLGAFGCWLLGLSAFLWLAAGTSVGIISLIFIAGCGSLIAGSILDLHRERKQDPIYQAIKRKN